jgi:hypothetical protein
MKPLNSFLWVLLLAAAVAAQNSSNTEATATVAVLVGAGDIASCDDLKGAEATATCSTEFRARCSPWETWLIPMAPMSSS